MFIRPDMPEGSLVACDACGTVAVLMLAPGWRSFRSFTLVEPRRCRSVTCHHCPRCAEQNELVRTGLVYGVARDTAVEYEEAGK